jgi:maltoporin
MESHPEEFTRDGETYHARWYDYVEGIKAYGNEADNAAIAAKLRDIRMGEIHEYVMDELVNGPERRRKEVEEREYERSLKNAAYQQQAAQQRQLQGYRDAMGQYQSHLGAHSQAQALGISTQSPSQPLVIGTGKEAMRIQANGDIQIGNETINEGLLKNIKKALKL